MKKKRKCIRHSFYLPPVYLLTLALKMLGWESIDCDNFPVCKMGHRISYFYLNSGMILKINIIREPYLFCVFFFPTPRLVPQLIGLQFLIYLPQVSLTWDTDFCCWDYRHTSCRNLTFTYSVAGIKNLQEGFWLF